MSRHSCMQEAGRAGHQRHKYCCVCNTAAQLCTCINKALEHRMHTHQHPRQLFACWGHAGMLGIHACMVRIHAGMHG